MKVSAKDLGTQKEQNITITGSSGLSDEEIEKAKKDAELHAEEDKKAEEAAKLKNETDRFAFAIEKVLKESKDKLGDELVKKAEAAVNELKEALKSNDLEQIKAKKAALEKLNTDEIVPKVYPSGSAGAYAGANGTPNFSQEDIEKMKNNPQFADLFKNMGAANPFNGSTTSADINPNDGTVDAEVTE